MNTIREAALHLLQMLDLPKGSANVLPITDGRRQFIRLLVDPKQLRRVERIPSTVDGYSVEIEERQRASPLLG
ncbi:hypothetical protein [Stenotrophomonas indicatrix]|uniref:hypothetical protein n=1 Tax=Stenotrophomonas indicatrix TaxID=2045451 RepID=UPI0028AD394F|nr:hypothetical protein [Stenotrophomonas indicatrix]